MNSEIEKRFALNDAQIIEAIKENKEAIEDVKLEVKTQMTKTIEMIKKIIEDSMFGTKKEDKIIS